MEDYLLYIFQGALPCLSDYLRINWSPFVPAADEHARLLEGIVHQLGRIPDMVTVELSPTEWETLGACRGQWLSVHLFGCVCVCARVCAFERRSVCVLVLEEGERLVTS